MWSEPALASSPRPKLSHELSEWRNPKCCGYRTFSISLIRKSSLTPLLLLYCAYPIIHWKLPTMSRGTMRIDSPTATVTAANASPTSPHPAPVKMFVTTHPLVVEKDKSIHSEHGIIHYPFYFGGLASCVSNVCTQPLGVRKFISILYRRHTLMELAVCVRILTNWTWITKLIWSSSGYRRTITKDLSLEWHVCLAKCGVRRVFLGCRKAYNGRNQWVTRQCWSRVAECLSDEDSYPFWHPVWHVREAQGDVDYPLVFSNRIESGCPGCSFWHRWQYIEQFRRCCLPSHTEWPGSSTRATTKLQQYRSRRSENDSHGRLGQHLDRRRSRRRKSSRVHGNPACRIRRSEARGLEKDIDAGRCSRTYHGQLPGWIFINLPVQPARCVQGSRHDWNGYPPHSDYA